jgi:4-amino-4-deoxy-L-arabinose transferase-like glycosyltransferase
MSWLSTSEKQVQFLKLYWLIASLSFFCTVFLPYMGEEAVYALGSMEMLYNHNYSIHTLLEHAYGRPPLYIWLIALLTKILGWHNVLLAMRIIVASVTVLTSYVLFLFANYLFKNTKIALLSVACYLTGDLLFRRGYLAYADPLFSLFILIALALLWVAVDKKNYMVLILAITAASCAFLTKALTVYIFYAVTAAALFWRHDNGKWLISPLSIMLHLLGLALPIIWMFHISPGDKNMLNDIIETAGTSATLTQHISHILLQPLRLIGLFAPASLVAIYLLLRKRTDYSAISKQIFILLVLVISINYLPYWIAIKGKDPRYIQPLYPFIAILLAMLIYAAREHGSKLLCYWLLVALTLKLIASCWGFYYYQTHFRSNYKAVAQTILQIAQKQPIYSVDVQFTGLSTVANINILRGSNVKPIGEPPNNFKNGYIISVTPQYANLTLVKHFHLKRTDLYLLCKGSACR